MPTHGQHPRRHCLLGGQILSRFQTVGRYRQTAPRSFASLEPRADIRFPEFLPLTLRVERSTQAGSPSHTLAACHVEAHVLVRSGRALEKKPIQALWQPMQHASGACCPFFRSMNAPLELEGLSMEKETTFDLPRPELSYLAFPAARGRPGYHPP